MRAAACSGSPSRPAASARRNSSARCRMRARALLAADHHEVVLVAVQIGHQHDAGFVEPGRCGEDVARKRHRRREDVVEIAQPCVGQRCQRGARGRCDRIEDAQQGVAMHPAVAGDQLRIIEVVAGVHAHALGQARAQRDLLVPVEQGELDAVDLGGMGRHHIDADVHRQACGRRGPSSRPAPDRTSRQANGSGRARAPG